MKKVVLFTGPKDGFNKLLANRGVSNPTPFMELIRQYNVKVRANDISGTSDIEIDRDSIENVVIYADDFSSVTEHVITNFSNIVLLGHDIQYLYIQNAPKRVQYSLRTQFGNELENVRESYLSPTVSDVAKLYLRMNSNLVVGQNEAKKASCVGLYKSAYRVQEQPTVMMYFGPSGVGKTELAKEISEFYGGALTRIQFSMLQTDEAYKYIFGDDHSKPSLARDLLSRESNVVLIDEFDKVSPGLYNVFYQMFDEGVFEDINYRVDVSQCIFILTSNFENEEKIANAVGLPIFSRIDQKIKFKNLSTGELAKVIHNKFEKFYTLLEEKDVNLISQSGLEDMYTKNVATFKNVRLLDKFIENDIYAMLLNREIKNMDDN